MPVVTPDDLVYLGKLIEKERKTFIEILTRLSTWKAAQDEVDHAIETLSGAPYELRELKGRKVNTLVAYLPPNVILFSYVLYVAIPSAICEHVNFRPSVRAREESFAIHQEVMRLLKLPAEMSYSSRSVFWANYTSHADVVVFTGRCQNVDEIESRIPPNQLFLFLGSGVNPFIVGQNADIEKAARDGANIRLSNSGQDCLCPDLFLIHEDVRDRFIDRLKVELDNKVYGDRRDPSTDYSNLSYPDVTEFCTEYLDRRRQDIIYGGEVNVLNRLVKPTILMQPIATIAELPEFFAPIFNIATYHDADQILNLVNSDIYRNKAMGAMLYGANDLASIFEKKHRITFDQTLFEINHGNLPFGGWDKCASHIRYQDKVKCQPVLISEAIRTNFFNATAMENVQS